MGFSHADLVFVHRRCLKLKKKGALSVMLQHAPVRVPISRRLVDETHAQRYGPGSGPVCHAAVTTAASTPSAVRVVAIFRRSLDDCFFLLIYAAVRVPILQEVDRRLIFLFEYRTIISNSVDVRPQYRR